MITYATTPDGVTPEELVGFFEGWPSPPSPETHLRLLGASSIVVLAVDADAPPGASRIVGFITAVSDGVLAAYIPLLEVRPAYRRRGIGAELVRRALDALGDLYMVDLVRDAHLQPFYERHGMRALTGMALRNRAALAGA